MSSKEIILHFRARLLFNHIRGTKIGMHKCTMSNHYQTTKKMMRIDRKENLSKNEVLRESLCYDEHLLCSFLCSVKINDPQNAVWWGISHAATARSTRSNMHSQNKIGIELDSSCAMQTSIDKTRSLVEKWI